MDKSIFVYPAYVCCRLQKELEKKEAEKTTEGEKAYVEAHTGIQHMKEFF